MAEGTRSRGTGSSPRQRAQRDLVDAGTKIPGVAEAVAAYGKLQPYVQIVVGQAMPLMRYATGGNQVGR